MFQMLFLRRCAAAGWGAEVTGDYLISYSGVDELDQLLARADMLAADR
jgi:hypothetical protein